MTPSLLGHFLVSSMSYVASSEHPDSQPALDFLSPRICYGQLRPNGQPGPPIRTRPCSGLPAAWGFSGSWRAGEFTAKSAQEVDLDTCLSPMDVAVDNHTNPSMVKVHLKQSKTDPFRHGVDIFLGRTNADLCPVAAIMAYYSIRPPVPGPFFVYMDGFPLTRDRLVTAIREALTRAGMDASHYSGHSFRVGAATTAAQAGLSDANVKMLSGLLRSDNRV